MVLITPHDLADGVRFAAPINGYGEGSGTETEGNYTYTTPVFRFPLNAPLARTLLEALPNTTFVSSPADNDAYPLLWGSIVPAIFLQPASLVVISVPSRRLVNNAVPMVPELQALGTAMGRILESVAQRVVVAISCDLAHTHLCSGPYGCNPAADVFDSLVAKWLRQPSETAVLVEQAAAVAPKALSCGFAGLVILSSMLRERNVTAPETMVGPYHPGYYGMVVASFKPAST